MSALPAPVLPPLPVPIRAWRPSDGSICARCTQPLHAGSASLCCVGDSIFLHPWCERCISTVTDLERLPT